MSDAKELLAEIDRAINYAYDDDTEALENKDLVLQAAADWIERWAPVVEAALGGRGQAMTAAELIDSVEAAPTATRELGEAELEAVVAARAP